MEISCHVQETVVHKPFTRLVRLVARVFYDDYTMEKDNQQKSAKSDSRGTGVVVLDALTRRQWVREEDLAKDLRLPPKQLRKIIRYFEEQKLVVRYHKKEIDYCLLLFIGNTSFLTLLFIDSKRAKMYSGAAVGRIGSRAEDNVKSHMQSYCCLDYAQIYDIVRYKLYNALDAMSLISMEDDSFHCENCNGELVLECNKLTSEEVVDGGDNARRQQREKQKAMLQNLEVQLQPLMDQINKVKDLPFPVFESCPAWEARAARENGDLNSNDSSRPKDGYGSTPMPFPGETKVEVNLGEGKEDVKSEDGNSSRKVLPPWMITQGMRLSQEQRGEIREEAKIGKDSGGAAQISDDRKSALGNGDNNDLKDDYFKACYAALLKQQELDENPNQQESASELTHGIESATTSSDRQVGMKSKREEEEDEHTPVAENGDYKMDSNVEAEEDDDEIDWIQG
ncbi:unnamed protein product [Cochlearia groenlandica]